MTDNELAIQVLQEMKENLFIRGWCKGQLVDYTTGEVCLAGSMATLTDYQKYQDTSKALGVVMDRLRDEIGPNIPVWNDAPNRTFNDVIQAIDNSIIKLKEGS